MRHLVHRQTGNEAKWRCLDGLIRDIPSLRHVRMRGQHRGVRSDAQENCHLNVKKLQKTLHFFQKKLPNIVIFQKNGKNFNFLKK